MVWLVSKWFKSYALALQSCHIWEIWDQQTNKQTNPNPGKIYIFFPMTVKAYLSLPISLLMLKPNQPPPPPKKRQRVLANRVTRAMNSPSWTKMHPTRHEYPHIWFVIDFLCWLQFLTQSHLFIWVKYKINLQIMDGVNVWVSNVYFRL